MEISKEQIEEWKAKYGEVYCVEVSEDTVDLDGETIIDLDGGAEVAKCYLRKPDTKISSLAYARMEGSPVDAGKVILKNCWLGGDKRIQDVPSFNTAAAIRAFGLADIRVARLKKL